jgi:hypothetical protein
VIRERCAPADPFPSPRRDHESSSSTEPGDAGCVIAGFSDVGDLWCDLAVEQFDAVPQIGMAEPGDHVT